MKTVDLPESSAAGEMSKPSITSSTAIAAAASADFRPLTDAELATFP